MGTTVRNSLSSYNVSCLCFLFHCHCRHLLPYTPMQPKVLNMFFVKPDELGSCRIHTPFHLREEFKPCHQHEYNLVSLSYSYQQYTAKSYLLQADQQLGELPHCQLHDISLLAIYTVEPCRTLQIKDTVV